MKEAALKWKNWGDFNGQHSTQLQGDNYWIEVTVRLSQQIFRMLLNQYVTATFSRFWRDAKRCWENIEPRRWAIRQYIGKRFCKSTGVFFIISSNVSFRHSFGFERPVSTISQKVIRSIDKHQFKIKMQVKNYVIFSGGDSSKNYGADKQRLQILDFHFDKLRTLATFACWKIRFKTEMRVCSQFPTEGMQWIKKNGDGWFSGWFEVSVINWGCEDRFSTEQSHP